MAEVYSFPECTLKRVGSTLGGTTETTVGAYAEGVNVSLQRDFGERFDTEGVRQKRIVLKTSAQMDIDKLYATDDYFFDGNDIKLYMVNSTGSEVWTFTDAYWGNKGLAIASEDVAKQNVSFVGNNFTQS